jgi:hypothetical protein
MTTSTIAILASVAMRGKASSARKVDVMVGIPPEAHQRNNGATTFILARSTDNLAGYLHRNDCRCARRLEHVDRS